MTRRYKYAAAAFVAILAVLGCTQAMLDKQALSPADTVQAPVFEVDPLWPKPLPNHWLLGTAIGVWVDEQDHVWIIHRSSATLDDNESGAEIKPPTGECCTRRAAGARVRPGRQPGRATGAGPARATSGPSRTTASSSTTRATSGSAATAAPTRTS